MPICNVHNQKLLLYIDIPARKNFLSHALSKSGFSLHLCRRPFQNGMSGEVVARPRPRKPGFQRMARGTMQVAQGRVPVARQRPKSTNITPSANVFINYIPAEFTEADLRELCSQFGEIVCSKIMINLETGQSKCFGFVKFATLAQAQAAIKGLNGREIGSKRLLAKYAESRERQETVSTMIYVKRLPITISPDFVAQLFSRFGHILSVTPHVMESIDPQYWRCFVQFSTYNAAAAAIASMNNQIIVAGSRPIHVRYADESRMGNAMMMSRDSLPIGATMTPSLIDATDEAHLLPSFLMM